MKILAVTDLTGFMTGGPATAAASLLAGLAARGHDIELAIDRPYAGLAGVRHIPFDASHSASTIGRAIERFAPDVVHLLSVGQRRLWQLSAVLHNQRWALTIHSLSPHERILRCCHSSDRLHYLLRDLRYLPNTVGWRATLARVPPTAVIVHSRMMHAAAKRFVRQGGRIAIIDLAAATPASSPAAGARPESSIGPRLLTIGGFAHSKGLHDAILATARLRTHFPRIVHDFIGEMRDESYFAHLQGLVRRLGLLQCTRFTVNAKDEEKRAKLREADLYVQPSHEEGFCLAFLEAANAVPRILGTATGAIAEMAGDDPHGRVVPPKRPTALASAALGLLESRADPVSLHSRQMRLSQRFNLETHVAQHEAVYQEMLAQPLARPLRPDYA